MDLRERMHAQVAEGASGMPEETNEDLVVTVLFEVDHAAIDIRDLEPGCRDVGLKSHILFAGNDL